MTILCSAREEYSAGLAQGRGCRVVRVSVAAAVAPIVFKLVGVSWRLVVLVVLPLTDAIGITPLMIVHLASPGTNETRPLHRRSGVFCTTSEGNLLALATFLVAVRLVALILTLATALLTAALALLALLLAALPTALTALLAAALLTATLILALAALLLTAALALLPLAIFIVLILIHGRFSNGVFGNKFNA